MATAVPASLQALDERFPACFPSSPEVARLFTGCRWAEGPAYFPAGRYLVWSDVRSNRMMRWDECTGAVGEFRSPADFSNGNTVDAQGRLVTCEHGPRRVVRTEHDGRRTVLADSWQGRRLNSPNDVVVHSDGSVWFSDPTYGIDSDEEGYAAPSETGGAHVYRIDPHTGVCAVVADDFVQPNGLAFSVDERVLYVSDTGASHMEEGPRHIRRFEVGPEGALRGGEVFATSTAGVYDGFRLDSDGRLWAGAGDGVHCYDPDGTLLGTVSLPETAANVAFGGPQRDRLFVTASTSLYVLQTAVRGAPLPVDRH